MPSEVPVIHPAVEPSPWWLAAGIAALVLAVVVLGLGVWRWHASRPRGERSDDSLDRLRTAALRQLDDDAAIGDPGAACRAISRTVQRFVGIASGGDADYQGAAQLLVDAEQDPRLRLVADFTQHLQRACFAEQPDVDVADEARRAREVIQAWR